MYCMENHYIDGKMCSNLVEKRLFPIRFASTPQIVVIGLIKVSIA